MPGSKLVIRAIGVSHTQLAKMSFDEIFDLTAGVYFIFCNIICYKTLRNGVWHLRTRSFFRRCRKHAAKIQ